MNIWMKYIFLEKIETVLFIQILVQIIANNFVTHSGNDVSFILFFRYSAVQHVGAVSTAAYLIT